MEPFKYGESSTAHTQIPFLDRTPGRQHADHRYLLSNLRPGLRPRRFHDARGREIIEIDGDSEDEGDIHIASLAGSSNTRQARPQIPQRRYRRPDLSANAEKEQAIKWQKRVTVGRDDSSSEVEEPLEKPRPARKRPRCRYLLASA
jgi:hypothetical protein